MCSFHPRASFLFFPPTRRAPRDGSRSQEMKRSSVRRRRPTPPRWQSSLVGIWKRRRASLPIGGARAFSLASCYLVGSLGRAHVDGRRGPRTRATAPRPPRQAVVPTTAPPPPSAGRPGRRKFRDGAGTVRRRSSGVWRGVA
jgi:hypothetical protein